MRLLHAAPIPAGPGALSAAKSIPASAADTAAALPPPPLLLPLLLLPPPLLLPLLLPPPLPSVQLPVAADMAKGAARGESHSVNPQAVRLQSPQAAQPQPFAARTLPSPAAPRSRHAAPASRSSCAGSAQPFRRRSSGKCVRWADIAGL